MIEHMFVDVQVTERTMRIVMTWVEPGPSGPTGGRVMTSAVEVGRGRRSAPRRRRHDGQVARGEPHPTGAAP
jgi:hypothetical protein